VLLHLGQMLVRQAEAIDARHRLRVTGRRRVLEFRDHAFAAAGIAGEAIHGDGELRRQKTGAYQRAHQRQKAGGPAARIAHPLGRCDAVIAIGFQFGEAVGPTRRHAMGAGGVDHPHIGIVDQRHGLLRRLVRQAQDHHIGVVERGFARRRILAIRLG
jgi:hypothetical protein